MFLMNLAQKAQILLTQNSSTILTGVGAVGTVGTAYLTGRASFRAAKLFDHAEKELQKDFEIEHEISSQANGESVLFFEPQLPVKTKVKLVWKDFVPPVAVGTVTVASIVLAHRIDTRKIVALTVASGISERAFKEYKEKVVEKLGERESTKIRDEIAQDRVTNTPLRAGDIIVTGDGKVLCMDMLTGRYFMSSMEDLKRAENKINHTLNQHMDASLTEFFEEVGLAPTTFSDQVGWNAAQMVELQISATMTPDDRPCLAVEFNPHPFSDYYRIN